jgi:hypothetical protein
MAVAEMYKLDAVSRLAGRLYGIAGASAQDVALVLGVSLGTAANLRRSLHLPAGRAGPDAERSARVLFEAEVGLGSDELWLAARAAAVRGLFRRIANMSPSAADVAGLQGHLAEVKDEP